MPSLPATNLTDAFNACDPARPLEAGDPRWVDLAAGRGDEGSAVAKSLLRILRSDRPLVQLLAGNRGCGKSTELRRLQLSLEQDGYFVAYFEVDGDLDLEDTEPPDILLAFIRNLEAALREKGIGIKKALLEEFRLWFGDAVFESAEQWTAIEGEMRSEIAVEGEIPLFAKLLARLTGQIKRGTESKENVRRKLDPQMSQLLDRGRLLVTAARSAIRKAGHKDLVVIADNLDRIALKDRGDGRTSHEVLFIDRGELLKSLGCHTVVTVPISLLFSPKVANLSAIFPDWHVLPMVRLAEHRTRQPWPPGRKLLDDILRQRLDIEALFEEGASDQLISGSGGHPRLLMTLVRYALDFVDDPPVTRQAAHKAIRRLVNDYDRSIPEHHWPLLARVHHDQAVLNDEDHQLMLFNLSVLEYQNDERWCDVQPAILQLPVFGAALARVREQRSRREPPESYDSLPDEPWRISRLEIADLRVFERLSMDFSSEEDVKGQWILLLGDNGVGKTTILRSVALACVQEQTASALLEWSATSASFVRQGAKEAHISARLSTGDVEFYIYKNTTAERFVKVPKPDTTLGPVFAYGCQRGTALGGPDRDVEFRTIDNVRTLFDDNGNLIHAETWLRRLQLAAHGGGREEAFFEAVRATLVETLPGVESIDTERDGMIWLKGPKVERAPLAAMSDGYITTVGWLLDLIARWAHWSRRLGIELDGDFRDRMMGLVLIDEIDLHLHPQWQVDIVSSLREQFPRFSFMVTTHNPLTLLGSRPGELHVLRRHPETNQVSVDQIDIPSGSRADQVLTGAWFGLSSTVDRETRALLAEHRRLLRERAPRSALQDLEAKIRARTGTFAETSLERLVHGVAAELIVEDLEKKTPEERQVLRDRILAETRRRRVDAAS